MVKMYHSVNMCYDKDDVSGVAGLSEKEHCDLLLGRAEYASGSGALLCVSDRPLCNIGIIVETNLERLFADDVESVKNGETRLVPDFMYDDGKIYNEAEGIDKNNAEEVYSWIKTEAIKLRGRSHNALSYVEAWGRCVKVVGVYVEAYIEDAGVIAPELLNQGEYLSNGLGVPLVVADRYVSIYDAE